MKNLVGIKKPSLVMSNLSAKLSASFQSNNEHPRTISRVTPREFYLGLVLGINEEFRGRIGFKSKREFDWARVTSREKGFSHCGGAMDNKPHSVLLEVLANGESLTACFLMVKPPLNTIPKQLTSREAYEWESICGTTPRLASEKGKNCTREFIEEEGAIHFIAPLMGFENARMTAATTERHLLS